jgi:hypothetical protein
MGAIIPQLLCTPELPNPFFLRAAFRRVYLYIYNLKERKKIRRTLTGEELT